MALFRPTIMLKRVTDVSIEIIKKLDVDTILLDVDNTIATHGGQEPISGAIEWVRKMENYGLKLVMVSNNFKSRVAPIAKKFDLPFISLSLKPSPIGFVRARKILGDERSKSLVIGDQIFTDIFGANLANMHSILLEPLSEKETLWIRFMRTFESRARKSMKYGEFQGSDF